MLVSTPWRKPFRKNDSSR